MQMLWPAEYVPVQNSETSLPNKLDHVYFI